jgi:hypothetical protein
MAQKSKDNAQETAPTATKSGFCIAEGCKKSTELAEFCGQHFLWFKLGLITKHGAKAKDFEKKLSQLNRHPERSL